MSLLLALIPILRNTIAYESELGGLPVYVDFDSYQCFTEGEISSFNEQFLSNITLTDIQKQELYRLGLVLGDWGMMHVHISYLKSTLL